MVEVDGVTQLNDSIFLEPSSLFSSYDDSAVNVSHVNVSGVSNSSSHNDDLLSMLNVPYTIMEALVASVAVIGNALVIIVFYRERRLRRRTNYYIISLALADFLVGLLGIPFAILVSIGVTQM
jgi:adenosine receptor A2a